MEITQMHDIIRDSEYYWLVRMCMNAFNVYLTMIHLIIHDSILQLQMEDDPQLIDALSYPLFLAGMDVMVYLSYGYDGQG